MVSKATVKNTDNGWNPHDTGDTEAPLGETHSSCFFLVFKIQAAYSEIFFEKTVAVKQNVSNRY